MEMFDWEWFGRKPRELEMGNTKQATNNGEVDVAAIAAEKRVILSMGGKGGVGKTSVMAARQNGSKLTRFRRNCWISTLRTRREDR